MRRKQRHTGRPRPRNPGKGPLLAVAAAVAVGALAMGAATLLLRPTWPGAAAVAAVAAHDAPALPISVSGEVFNVPPAAIRVALQRRPGAQPRLDLAFSWPDFTPPRAPAAKAEPLAAGSVPAGAPEQVFITIAGSRGVLPLGKRVTEIYARYAESLAFTGPDGLLGVPFKDGTPYGGEDLVFEAEQPERFVARCTRDAAQTPGSCLLERHIGGAELTIRFRREWLDDWRRLASGVDRLLASLHGGES